MQWSNPFKRNKQASRRQFNEDRAILLICMGIALLFWIFIKLSREYTARKRIEFSVEVPESRAFTEELPRNIYVDLDGTGWDLLYEFFNAPTLTLPYAIDPEQGAFVRSRTQLRNDIQAQLKNRSLGIRSFNLDGINISLEDLRNKNVVIRPRLDLSFAPGFQMQGSIEVEPDSVLLTGPGPMVDSIRSWPTDSLNLRDLQKTTAVNLDLQDGPAVIRMDPSEVTLQIPVEQFTETSVYVPIQIRNLPDSSLRIFPNNISVSCIVGLSRFNEVTPQSFRFLIDFENVDLQQEVNKVPIQLDSFPAFVRNVNFNPKEATFFLVRDSTDQQAPDPGN